MKTNDNLWFTQHWDSEISHTVLIVKKEIFQIKILDEMNFFLIILCMLIPFKVFIYYSYTFLWSSDIPIFLWQSLKSCWTEIEGNHFDVRTNSWKGLSQV